jgi:hypothetical protein
MSVVELYDTSCCHAHCGLMTERHYRIRDGLHLDLPSSQEAVELLQQQDEIVIVSSGCNCYDESVFTMSAVTRVFPIKTDDKSISYYLKCGTGSDAYNTPLSLENWYVFPTRQEALKWFVAVDLQ